MLNQVLGRRSIRLALVTVSAGVLLAGSFALAQIEPVKLIAAINPPEVESLSLSFSQMQALEDAVEAHRASFEALLTAAQLDQLTALRVEYRDDTMINPDEDPVDRLNLSPGQKEELAALRTILMAQFEAILTPQQLQQLAVMGLIVPAAEGP